MEEVLGWLSQWVNWPFLFTLFAGLLMVGIDALGASDIFGGLDTDLDIDADIDADFDADADVDADADGAGSRLGWLGVGRVPLTLLVEWFLVCFGCIGLLITSLLPFGGLLAFFISVPLSLFGSALVVRTMGERLARITPADSTISSKPSGFIGRVAVVVSKVTTVAGQIRVESPRKGVPDALLMARVPQGHNPISSGTTVVVVEYVSDGNAYLVHPLEVKEAL